jgi:hypothetical protein
VQDDFILWDVDKLGVAPGSLPLTLCASIFPTLNLNLDRLMIGLLQRNRRFGLNRNHCDKQDRECCARHDCVRCVWALHVDYNVRSAQCSIFITTSLSQTVPALSRPGADSGTTTSSSSPTTAQAQTSATTTPTISPTSPTTSGKATSPTGSATKSGFSSHDTA